MKYRTLSGKWALMLTLVFIGLISVKLFLTLPLPTPIVAVLGLVGFALGITALVKHDRSLSVLFSIAVGLIIVTWIIGRMMFLY
ncbi:hypothetical protein [Alkalicoccus halolimnae]|uniref:Uncharacterized protein n=1 Tax=Alkalicoccus halolimnae TaxID=1667239 RepID=A0A5C7FFD2_9BACI|nr:hypothetical protein [Alkalicoccus halolimnae]TXF84675.1 hypothetical protein FTX54_10775 [Alkalicoccus halolimnae]